MTPGVTAEALLCPWCGNADRVITRNEIDDRRVSARSYPGPVPVWFEVVATMFISSGTFRA
jgi:hypothetical protein